MMNEHKLVGTMNLGGYKCWIKPYDDMVIKILHNDSENNIAVNKEWAEYIIITILYPEQI